MRLLSIFVCLALALPTAGAAQADRQRAVLNYRMVVTGQKKLLDLSPIEKAEVYAVARARKNARAAPFTPAEQCWHDQLTNNPAPSKLEEEVIDLKCSQL